MLDQHCWCQRINCHLLCKKIILTLCEKQADVDDKNGQNRHQHLLFVTNTFRLQHRSSASLLPDFLSLKTMVPILCVQTIVLPKIVLEIE